MNSEPMPPQAATSCRDLVRLLAEPYAFALVAWPAVVGLFATLPAPWERWIRACLGLCLVAIHLAAYSGGRRAGFGHVMLLNSGIVTLACLTHPSAWTLGWLPLLLVGLHAAQRARLKTAAWRTTTPFGIGPGIQPAQPASLSGGGQCGREMAGPLPASSPPPETQGE